jgi:hypothetical protein
MLMMFFLQQRLTALALSPTTYSSAEGRLLLILSFTGSFCCCYHTKAWQQALQHWLDSRACGVTPPLIVNRLTC